MQRELIELKNEIRDLKTAQQRPSIMRFYTKSFTIPQNITKGFHYWTIYYEDTDNQTKPIAYNDYFLFVPEFYDSATNTQRFVFDIPYDGTYGGDEYTIFSTRPINAIIQDS